MSDFLETTHTNVYDFAKRQVTECRDRNEMLAVATCLLVCAIDILHLVAPDKPNELAANILYRHADIEARKVSGRGE